MTSAPSTAKPSAPKSAALAKREEAFGQLSAFLGKNGIRQRLAMALPKHMTPDRMVRIALSAASRQPLLLECSIESIALSLIRAAEFGLETDGWDAHLVPFKNKKTGQRECQLIPDYKGLAKLAYQSELVLEIMTGAVREGDSFDYELGTNSFLRHKPSESEKVGALTHAWAMAKIKGGGCPFVVLNRREVLQHKQASAAGDSEFSPWNNPATEPDMWKKTAMRVLAKLIPRSPTLREALKHEDALEIGGEVIDGALVGPGGEDAETPKQSRAQEVADKIDAKGAALSAESRMRSEYQAAMTAPEVAQVYDCQCGPSGWITDPKLTRQSETLRRVREAELSGAPSADLVSQAKAHILAATSREAVGGIVEGYTGVDSPATLTERELISKIGRDRMKELTQ